ncbi:gamma-glutamyltranspeptidase [Lentinula aciculospora]|uniref:Glutathione hydrolase n=1 Tax=Lentinula aciculospora TaxID=153920 RepID=A0A9W9DTM1_9AGAR|nr:gamma-glutamyltranspeptidase [Lentinula aciculospora]
MNNPTYIVEKHTLEIDVYNLHDYTSPTPAIAAFWKKTFLKFIAVVGLAVACTTAFVHIYAKPADGVLYPRLVLKEPKGFAGGPRERNPAYLIEAEKGVVATENKRCSDLGVFALRKGGSAVDAAITATLGIGVVNSFSSGIGGAGFMTVRVPPARPGAKSKVFTIDFRGTAPAATTPTMFDDGNLQSSISGGLSMTIPGELAGLQTAHDHWGALSGKELVVPDAELAMRWTVDKEFARRIQWFPDLFRGNPDFSSIFAPKGVLLKEGEPIERNNYALTLMKIAEGGANTEITKAFVDKINATDGHATVEDFQKYRPIMYRSLEGFYRGKKLYTARAPFLGPGELLLFIDSIILSKIRTCDTVLLHMLNLVKGYNFTRRNRLDTRMVEAMKFGNAEELSDPNYRYDTALIDEMHTKQFTDEVREMLDDPDPGTSHISPQRFWGAQVLDPITGIVINNQMNDFSTFNETNIFGEFPARCKHYLFGVSRNFTQVFSILGNLPQPGKRPLSSICPTIIENADGSPYIAIGASGGPTIFFAVFQTLINTIDYEPDPSEAIEFGRLHNQLKPEGTFADETYRADILDALLRKRHSIEVLDIYRNGSSCVQAVMRDPKSGLLLGASDSRKNGIAAGY